MRMTAPLALRVVHENVFVICILMGVSLTLLIISLILHFYQHFKCRFCFSTPTTVLSSRQRSSSLIETVKYKRLRCLCGTNDGDDFDFFPMTFFIYLIVVLLLCLILIGRFIITLFNTNTSWNDTVNQFEYPSLNDMTTISFNNKTLIELIIDYIVVYLTMILSLMESLFSFYRFYTTLMTTKHLKLITTQDVIKNYTLYSLLFILFYAVNIHLYFWIFPITILMHCIFGIYCNSKFASTLILSYTDFVGAGLSVTKANEQVLESVYFMRKASIICTVLQTIYLLIFIIIYYINFHLVIIYLPILWSITSFIFMTNFVRNRLCVQHPFKCCTTLLNKQQSVKSASDLTTSAPVLSTPIPTKISILDTQIKPMDVTAPKHVAFDINLETKVPIHQMEAQRTITAAEVKDIDINHASNNDIMAIRVTGPGPPAIDVSVSNVDKSKTKSGNTPVSPYTPESVGGTKANSTFRDFVPEEGIQSQIDRRGPGSHNATMGSMEFTQNMSMMEMSIQTETDIGGRKLEEYNRHIMGLNPHPSNRDIHPMPLPTPQMGAQKNTGHHLKPGNIDLGANALDISKPNGVDNSPSHHLHKLDVVSLTLQLSLLKKFGFDVNQLKKSFG